MLIMMKKVFLGLGGNLGDSQKILDQAVQEIKKICSDVVCSQYYVTAPVSPEPQPDYLNAVCKLNTNMSALELLKKLQNIEKKLGKIPKPKTAPRKIDIDILLFGTEKHNTTELEVPHPRWHERLFVLEPLLDLIEEVTLPCGKIINIRAQFNKF
jgi:2-amino-4-hydroxy-6-hydroxymethyldihydropteridine diphosphokinase